MFPIKSTKLTIIQLLRSCIYSLGSGTAALVPKDKEGEQVWEASDSDKEEEVDCDVMIIEQPRPMSEYNFKPISYGFVLFLLHNHPVLARSVRRYQFHVKLGFGVAILISIVLCNYLQVDWRVNIRAVG